MKTLETKLPGRKTLRHAATLLWLAIAAAGAADPDVAAPVPTRSADDVLSIYNSSATYENANVDTFLTGWSQATLADFEIPGSGSTVKRYSALNYAGVEFFNPKIDASQMTHFHVDLWTPDATKFAVKLVSFPPGGGFSEFQVNFTSTTITQNNWVSLDIPLAQFAGVNRGHLAQLLWVDNVGGVENGTFFIDNVYLYNDGSVIPPDPEPQVPAPTPPARAAADVVALYNSSAIYTNVNVDTFRTGWSQTTLADHTIPANPGPPATPASDVKLYTGLNFAGVEFFNPKIDASQMTHFHVDLWTPNATKFAVKLVSFSPGAAEFQVNFTSSTIVQDNWVSLDIPLNQFTGVDRANLGQLLWVDNVGGVENGTFYIDNVYFYKAPPAELQASISTGKLVTWQTNVANTYLAQGSSDGANWVNVGGVVAGGVTSGSFDGASYPFHRVLETSPDVGNNVVLNSGFEANTANGTVAADFWNSVVPANPGAVVGATDQGTPYAGARFLRMSSVTAASGPVSPPNTDVRSDFTPVDASLTYTFAFHAAHVSKIGGANPQSSLFFYDAGNVPVGGPIFTSFAGVGSEWTLVSQQFTPPAGATKVTVGWIQAAGAANGLNWETWIDNATVYTGGFTPGTTSVIPAQVQAAARIAWPSSVGMNYQPYSSPDLQNWMPLGGVIAGTASTATQVDPITSSRKFFKVLELP